MPEMVIRTGYVLVHILRRRVALIFACVAMVFVHLDIAGLQARPQSCQLLHELHVEQLLGRDLGILLSKAGYAFGGE